MGNFEIGDKVVVCSKIFVEQNGLYGKIVAIDPSKKLSVRIQYDENQYNHPYLRDKQGYSQYHHNSYAFDDIIKGEKPCMADTRDYLEAVAR